MKSRFSAVILGLSRKCALTDEGSKKKRPCHRHLDGRCHTPPPQAAAWPAARTKTPGQGNGKQRKEAGRIDQNNHLPHLRKGFPSSASNQVQVATAPGRRRRRTAHLHRPLKTAHAGRNKRRQVTNDWRPSPKENSGAPHPTTGARPESQHSGPGMQSCISGPPSYSAETLGPCCRRRADILRAPLYMPFSLSLFVLLYGTGAQPHTGSQVTFFRR